VGPGTEDLDQPGDLTILEKRSDGDFVVTYRLNPEAYQLTRQGDGSWHLNRVERP
jgi:hypothetical protein